MTDLTAIVSGLTKAQRALVLESEPGAWGNPERATGAEVIGAGRFAAAQALERKGLGEVQIDANCYPYALWLNNGTGLAVRAALKGEG